MNWERCCLHTSAQNTNLTNLYNCNSTGVVELAMWWCATELYLQVTLLCGRTNAMLLNRNSLWLWHVVAYMVVVWLRRAYSACIFICSIITLFFLLINLILVHCGVAMCDDIWKKREYYIGLLITPCIHETWVGRDFYRICCALLMYFTQNIWKY